MGGRGTNGKYIRPLKIRVVESEINGERIRRRKLMNDLAVYEINIKKLIDLLFIIHSAITVFRHSGTFVSYNIRLMTDNRKYQQS